MSEQEPLLGTSDDVSEDMGWFSACVKGTQTWRARLAKPLRAKAIHRFIVGLVRAIEIESRAYSNGRRTRL